MFSDPLSLTVDYPDSYYTDLPEPIRLGYKYLATLLLRDIALLLNNPALITAHRRNQVFEVKKIVSRHVEMGFDVLEDIVGSVMSSKSEAIRAGVVEEYSVHRLICDDASIRDTMEREAIAFVQSIIFLSLDNKRIMRSVTGSTSTLVKQQYDYLKVSFS